MDELTPCHADWVQDALRQYEAPLTRYAARITGDADRARDVVQDTFVRLCGQDPARLNGKLAEWLFTVCRHRALDVQRKENRMTSLETLNLDACASREPSPAAAAEQSETAGQILRLLGALPPRQQEAVRLKFQSGLSYQQISRVMTTTVGNVGVLIHTGLKTLREHLRRAEMGARTP